MDEEIIVAIKKETEQVFGRRVVSSRDCNALCEEIFDKTGFNINANTLRRFFGLIKASHTPSPATLQILCTYCGFRSGDEVKKLHEKKNGITLTEDSVLNYLVYPFKNIWVKDERDETFTALINGVIVFVNRHAELADKFHREIAKTKNGQTFYFERFVNFDKLNSFYGDGLRYYLSEKRSPDAQTFGHSLLVFRSWLIKDNEKLASHFKAVKAAVPARSNNPFICGRLFASRLYYADAYGLDTQKLLSDAQKSYATLKHPEESYGLFRSFEYGFAQALVLTGHYEEALFYIENVKSSIFRKKLEIDLPFYETISLLEILALYKTGSYKQAEKLFDNIQPSNFYFLSKKYKTILYLRISSLCERTLTKTNDQLNELIKETGFIRFADQSFLN